MEPARIDILMGLKEMDFRDCWERREKAEIDGLAIYFISVSDLIFNKETTGRPMDLVDAERLKQSLKYNK